MSPSLLAREQFPWAKNLPEKVFFNDVLPYASLDETREPWRKDFHSKCSVIVKDSNSATQAAQAINREFFKLINVHYNTGRKAPNQSPSESQKLGMATCTGLSIILVDAARSASPLASLAQRFGPTSEETTLGSKSTMKANGTLLAPMNSTRMGSTRPGSPAMPQRPLPMIGNTRSGPLPGKNPALTSPWSGI